NSIKEEQQVSIALPGGVKELVDGANQFDADLFMSAFGEGALVNDRHRQFWGSEAIRRWCEIEITGDRVTIEPVEVVEHYGDVIVTAKFDGDYDRSDLPPELFLQLYCALRNDKVVQLILLPMDGRPLSKATVTSIAATAYSAELPEGARSPLDVGRCAPPPGRSRARRSGHSVGPLSPPTCSPGCMRI